MHLRARASKGSYAFTVAASDGRGKGSVLIQWFMRKSEAPSGPRFGSQLFARLSSLVSSGTFLKVYGVSSVMLSYARWYQGAAPAWFSARKTTRFPESTSSRSVGHFPLVGPE